MLSSLNPSERFTELHREEKREEGKRGEKEEKRGNQKERDRSRQCSVPYMLSAAQSTHRDSQNWLKRRGREEIEVTWGRKRRVKRGRE